MHTMNYYSGRAGLILAAFLTVSIGAGLASAAPPAGSATAAAPWPGWLGPNRDGHSPDTGLLKAWPAAGPKLLWKVDNLGAGWSSAAIANQRVYVTGNSAEEQMLFCFDLNGRLVWQVPQGPKCSHKNYPGARSTPTVDGERLYVTGGEGLVTCHEATSGKILWKRDMASLVEVIATGGKLVGKFQVAGTGKSWAYPVVAGGRLYLRYDSNLYCYDVKTE